MVLGDGLVYITHEMVYHPKKAESIHILWIKLKDLLVGSTGVPKSSRIRFISSHF